jgi:16S rRNA (guanine1207-N2)-methyltransferase
MDRKAMDPHYKKTVTLKMGDRRLDLQVAQDLFSSHEVDVGTRLLLRTLAGPEHNSRRLVLDLGCGYGPIGLGLKATSADRVVHMVDRDALAVAYSRENAARNRLLDGVEVYGSLGYDDVRTAGFDLIASNIPAKAGTPVIDHFLLDAAELLAPDGLVAIVVIAPLEASVAATLEQSPDIEIVFRRTTASYAVFHYRFRDSGASSAALGRTAGLRVYERQRVTISRKGVKLRMRTAYGLPEFDSLNFATELVADAALRMRGQNPKTTLVLNPGQGYIPLILWAALQPDEIRLIDRDLLALRFSEANLLDNGCSSERICLHHQDILHGMGVGEADLVIGVLRPKEPPNSAAAIVRQMVSKVSRGGRVVLGASSTVVTRCLTVLEAEKLQFKIDRRRNRGFSVIVLQRV